MECINYGRPVNWNSKMASILICFLLLLSIIVRVKPAEIAYLTSYCPSTTTTYTEGSKFQFNLNRLLYRFLYNNDTNSIYAKSSVGENDDDKVHGLFLCRGDIAPKDCQNCTDMASERIQRECPLKKQATILYDHCLIRYSDTPSFASTFSTSSYYWILYSTQSVSVTEQVKYTSVAMFNNLISKAANGQKYAESIDQMTQKLYGMVQCIPDLSAADCRACLQGARSAIPKSVPREYRIVHESCHLSYQVKNSEPVDKGRIKLICIIIGVTALLAVVLAGFCLYLIKRRRRTQQEENERIHLMQLLHMEGTLYEC